MPADHELIQARFDATESRQAILRTLVLEFAGVELKIIPTGNPDDYYNKHVELTFISEKQREAFFAKMFQLGQEERRRRGDPPLR